jgi:hypothetical protein
MKIDERHVSKTDPLLEDTLKHAREDENIRAVMVLGSDKPTSRIDKELHPSQFPSRQAWRKALVEQHESQLEHEIGGTLEKLRRLSLKPRGGQIGRAVVVEGPAANIAASLTLPGVEHASLDRSIELLK